MSERSQAPEPVRRKLTRVYLEVVRRGRLGLFETLTKANEAEIELLLDQNPVFHNKRESAPRRLLIDESISGALPDDFFTDPTAWIERQPNIDRGFTAEYKKELETVLPIRNIRGERDDIDVARVKLFTLQQSGTELRVVSKRLNPKKADFEEVRRARMVQELGIPTPRVLAEIVDQGNLYAWFEYIPSLDIDAVNSRVPHNGYFTDTRLAERIEHFRSKLTADQMQSIEVFLEKRRKALVLQEQLQKAVIAPIRNDFRIVSRYRRQIDQAKGNFEYIKDIVLECMSDLIAMYRAALIPGPWFEELHDAWRNIHSVDALATALAFSAVRSFYGFSDVRESVVEAYPGSDVFVDLDHFGLRAYTASDKIAQILSSTVFRAPHELYRSTEAFKAMCAEKGFHAENRNILLRWDFNQDEPLRDAAGNLQFYLIDLETSRHER